METSLDTLFDLVVPFAFIVISIISAAKKKKRQEDREEIPKKKQRERFSKKEAIKTIQEYQKQSDPFRNVERKPSLASSNMESMELKSQNQEKEWLKSKESSLPKKYAQKTNMSFEKEEEEWDPNLSENPSFDFHKREEEKSDFSLDHYDLREAMILSEILGKPKSMKEEDLY
ncbi:hypothetical protein LQU94_01860 [Peptoniphilus sp. KCTC 25270]|uniref:hypothetical protein n=1 Tax=Peptoniphilus sp. KCTC 25270 TaxID=2897414 RepID=UPI001E617476|nr:hypothetical protein [Peptoniphilus sp. KCTC 25270]MCD1146861.1 hypothetical protein [Peptoniphilus sp. KCTC 25270]